MNLIKLIDKQSNKLVSKSGVTFDKNGNLNLAYIPKNYSINGFNPTSIISQYTPTLNSVSNTDFTSAMLSNEAFYTPETTFRQTPYYQEKYGNTNTAIDRIAQLNLLKSNSSSTNNDDKWLELATQAQNDYRGMQIANGVFGGMSSLTNMGLGIWNAVEQSQNNAKLRDVYDKQMALAQEQIDASKELRKQRQEEIDRLKRVRSNTNQRFNSSAIVSRSY